jgi:hypothetical protein
MDDTDGIHGMNGMCDMDVEGCGVVMEWSWRATEGDVDVALCRRMR